MDSKLLARLEVARACQFWLHEDGRGSRKDNGQKAPKWFGSGRHSRISFYSTTNTECSAKSSCHSQWMWSRLCTLETKVGDGERNRSVKMFSIGVYFLVGSLTLV